VLIVADFAQSASNPPLDAARLDIIVPRLWGRAEAVRTVIRASLQALAPLVFGAVAQYLFGGRHHGLEDTFLVMLVPLLASGLILMLARRTYGTDVATADASLRALSDQDDLDGERTPHGPRGGSTRRRANATIWSQRYAESE
jgi:predicted phage tail protein